MPGLFDQKERIQQDENGMFGKEDQRNYMGPYWLEKGLLNLFYK